MGSTKIEQPSTPAAPTTADSVQAWVDSLPAIYEAQMKYAPLQAQQQVSLAQQYAAPLGQAQLAAQQAMYPQTTALQEKLATAASQGMDSGLPDWAKQSYQDTFRAQLGDNALSGVGADYMSRGMMQQEKDWRDYYNNLGLSVAGRQPLSSPGQAQTSDYMSQFTPNSVMGYNAQNYGNYSNAYSSMYGSNQQAQASANDMWAKIIGGGMQGTGSALQGSALMMSSKDFKDNIRDNDIDSVELVKSLDIVDFEYKGSDKKQVGIIVENSPELLKSNDGKHVDTVNLFGVLTDALQKTIKKVEVLEAKYA